MKNFIFLAIILLITLGACQKEKEEISPIQQDEVSSITTNDSTVSTGNGPKTSSSVIMNATNPSQIPNQMFAVNPIYKTVYYHYKQPDNISCSWTSYVNCINCVVTASNNYCYSTSINTVKYRCQNYYPQASQNGANSILALEWHAVTYDCNKVNFSRKSPTDRWEATKRMLSNINNYHSPFVVRSSMNGVGHYRVVFSIDWKQSESASIVYYTDCYPTQSNGTSFQTNFHSMNLYQFLNLMTVGASCYNMLFMWPI